MEIFDLTSIPYAKISLVGGKAKGLYELHSAGLEIARGYVITGIENNQDIEEAASFYEKSGLKLVAVRSSANAEDGGDFSAAGQFSSFLGVSGREEVLHAIESCVASLKNATASSYAAYFDQAKSSRMSVVLQELIQAEKAGVCFTRDPLTGGNDIVIEAVEGMGEQLVSGWSAARQYRIASTGGKITGDGLLSTEEINKIVCDVKKAELHLQMPLDTEWAIDKKGRLYWLQARPITAMSEPGIGELDVSLPIEGHLITNCNIGEMLPGAVTPLSLSTSVRAIDWGMRKMFIETGVYKDFNAIAEGSCAFSVGNHLFLDITTMSVMADRVAGASSSAVELSICGRVLKEYPKKPGKKANIVKRIINGGRYFKLLQSKDKARKEIGALASAFDIPLKDNAEDQFAEIDKNLAVLDHAFWLHYITSVHSGSMSSALFFILREDLKDDEKTKAVIAGLLEDIDGIESVDILRSLRRLAKALLKQSPAAAEYSLEELKKAVFKSEGEVREAYDYFIRRHGHRAVREAEIRSLSWKNDEQGLLNYLKSVLISGGDEPKKEAHAQKNIEDLLSRYKGIKKKALQYFITQAREGVKNREYSKSMCIKVLDRFKTAYAHMASLMKSAGLLPEEDLIYFLQQKEIENLIYDKQARYIKKALARKRLFDEQKNLKFNEISFGKPEPVKLEINKTADGTVLKGVPISRGCATGKARVVKSIEDANNLQKGEIMVAAFTDIGWSPYYSLIGALVTEVGSQLSHGAVVAREYALPLVSNIAHATDVIRTGDRIAVNGNDGTVAILV